MADKNELKRQSYEQLAEKQVEEIDKMQSKRYDLPLSTHTNPHTQSVIFSELFSGIPVYEDRNETEENENPPL